MKTKKLFLVFALFCAMLTSTAFAGEKNANYFNDLQTAVKDAIQDKLIFSNKINVSEADIVVKVEQDGTLNAVEVIHPEKEVVKRIKKIFTSEQLSNTKAEPGIYVITLKSQVK